MTGQPEPVTGHGSMIYKACSQYTEHRMCEALHVPCRRGIGPEQGRLGRTTNGFTPLQGGTRGRYPEHRAAAGRPQSCLGPSDLGG